MFCDWDSLFLMSNWAIPGALKIYQMILSYCDSLWRSMFARGFMSMSILVNHVALTSLEGNEMKKEFNATKAD